MKSLILLLRNVLNELGTWCRTSTTRDYEYISRRVEDEGLSFLTITLPTFGRDLQKGLDQGYVDAQLFQSFRKGRGGRGGLPLFLGGFLDLIFDRGTGMLLSTPNVDAIFAIRQITLMFSKISLPCTDARVRKAIEGYIECEQHVKKTDGSLDELQKSTFLRISALLFSDTFATVDHMVWSGTIVPKHGPGTTVDGLLGNQKYRQVDWTDRLEKVFPSWEFLLPNERFFEDLSALNMLEPGAERPVKVITVPKTLKTPRIIAVEPTAMQYAQQGLMEAFVETISRDNLLGRFIGFLDQEPNRQMARKGSLWGESLATLDLSEASDRVSNQLVRLMLHRFPYLAEGVDACRSRKADVPGHGVIRLSKFASMGSALTFPIEAMVFLTLIFMGIERELNIRLTKKTIHGFLDQVRVFGDDIIVPVDFVPSVVSCLETFGFKVNADKSFWTGRFRESCGKDYYDGHDITVVKVRRMFPTQRKDVPEVISLVSLRNQLYQAGLWRTCGMLDEKLEAILGYFPAVSPTSSVLGRCSFLGYDTERMHPHLQSPLVRGFRVVTRSPINSIDGPAALLKVFLKRGNQPFADRNHLERSGRPDAVDIKLGWMSPF